MSLDAAPGGPVAWSGPGARRVLQVEAAPDHAASRARLHCRLPRRAGTRQTARARAVLDVLAPALAAAVHLRTCDGGAGAPFAPAHAAAERTPSARLPTAEQTVRAEFGLTARQMDVVRLLLLGRRNAEIAGALGVREATARHHTERVLAKLGVRSRAEVFVVLAGRVV